MILFAVLVAAFAVSYLVLRHGRHRDAARWAMAVAMVFAGVSHFLDPCLLYTSPSPRDRS